MAGSNKNFSDFPSGFNSGDLSLVEDQTTHVFKHTTMIESGAGYIKFADGTMICYGTVNVSVSASTFGSAAVTWPVSFAATPTTVHVAVDDGHYSYWASSDAKSTTGCTAYVATGSSSTATVRVSYVAIGAWA